MKRGLNIDGLDVDELLHTIEDSFDVEIGGDSINWYTVGDIHEWLLTKLASSGHKCASAMCFYRLRRALITIGVTGRISPATQLAELSDHSPKVFIEQLKNASQLRLPATLISQRWVIGLAAIGVSAVAVLALAALKLQIAGFGYGIAVILFALGILALRFDAGVIPEDWATVGALARRAGALNFGQLAPEGARFGRDDVWDALAEITSEITGISKSEIDPNTYIVRPRPKKSA